MQHAHIGASPRGADVCRALNKHRCACQVQYELQVAFEGSHAKDNMDYAVSNTLGALAAVLFACGLSSKMALLSLSLVQLV